MRTALTSTACALLVALSAAPAFAQSGGSSPPPPPPPPPPVLLPPPPSDFPDRARRDGLDATRLLVEGQNYGDRYRKTIDFATCVHRTSPERLQRFLQQPVGSASERRSARSLLRFAPGCSSRGFVASVRFLRGASSEVILGNLGAQDPEQAKTVQSDRAERFFANIPDSSGEKDAGARALAAFTQCQVLLAPGLARRVIEAKPDSADETRLRRQLLEVTPSCGSIKISGPLAGVTYRSYLAEALYHWTRSAAQGSLS